MKESNGQVAFFFFFCDNCRIKKMVHALLMFGEGTKQGGWNISQTNNMWLLFAKTNTK